MKTHFLSPPDEFSPLPFWFWNDAIDEPGIRRWMADFHDKGVAGFVLHPRIGIPTDLVYLSNRFLDLVRFAVTEAEAWNMKVVLYDEAMYPSGSAHGEVVRLNPEYATRALCCVPEGATLEAGQRVVATASGHTLVEGFSGGTIRGIHFGEDDGEASAPAAADILNPLAVASFLQLTHERYYQALKPWFGTTVIAMFTDEPDVLGRNHRAGAMPWTPGFLDWYQNRGGEVLDLVALWHPVPDAGVRQARYRSAVQARLAEAYYSPLAAWCEDHGIALTGHPHDSSDIGVQRLFHIPGQDIVWRWVAPENGKALEGEHSTMARCSSDAARMMNRRRNTNECFGCCGPDGVQWALTAGDMKWYLDWLFVRGVNMVMPHAFYYSVDGPRRYGERPPDVGPNNHWWPHYRRISTYIKRLCWLLTDTVEQASVAVLAAPDRLPWKSVAPLYRGQTAFHYLLAEVLAAEARVDRGRILLHRQSYSCLVIEDSVTDALALVPGLAAKVQEFRAQGGLVVSTGTSLPGRIEAVVVTEGPCPDLRASHGVKQGLEFVLLVNEGEEALHTWLRLPQGRVAELWAPWEGTITAVSAAEQASGRYELVLERRQSLVLRLAAPGEGGGATPAQAPQSPTTAWEVPASGWTVSGLPSGVVAGPFGSDVSQWPGMAGVSTTLVWEASVTLGPGEEPVELDCGQVGESAQVWVNGVDAGVCLWAPYRFAVGGLFRPGPNQLRIEVSNSLSHRYEGRGAFSGLGGPVVLKKCITPVTFVHGRIVPPGS